MGQLSVGVVVIKRGAGRLQTVVDVAAEQQPLDNRADAELRGDRGLVQAVERAGGVADGAAYGLVVDVGGIAEAEGDDQGVVDKHARHLAGGALRADSDERL